MAATWTKVPSQMPSKQASNLITNVEVGDKIDIVAVLGRPARRLQMYTSSVTDEVQYKLNNLLKVRQRINPDAALTDAQRRYGVYNETVVDVWSGDPGIPTYSNTGDVIETAEGLEIASIEIVALTLSVGTTIQLVVW